MPIRAVRTRGQEEDGVCDLSEHACATSQWLRSAPEAWDVTVSVGRAPQLEGLAEAAKCDGAGLEDDDA